MLEVHDNTIGSDCALKFDLLLKSSNITVDTKFPTRLQPRVQAPLLIEPSPLNSPSPIHTMATKSIRPLSRLRPSAHLSPKPLSHSRSFHSYDHPAPPPPFTAVESSILSAATHHIPSHGFTHTTLALGARDAGYLDASTNLFPRGAFSVVHYYLWAKREGLKDVVKELEAREGGVGSAKAWKEMGVGGRVKALTWERLMGNREVVHRWQEALALLATPSSLPTAISELASLSDEIFFLSGDVSVDSSWYTKRASLSTIYAASELFMTTDKSEGYKETREFMERRFEDGRVVGSALGNAGQWVGFTASAVVNILRSKGVRI